MSTRLKLLLSLLACVLCFAILWSSSSTHQPFSRLHAVDIASFEVETTLRIPAHIEDPEEISALVELLRGLTISGESEPAHERQAYFLITRQDGNQYQLEFYDSIVVLDGIPCAADSAQTDAFCAFAARFA